ncbi:MAG: DOMON-like domain-containing protein [Gammaproteobacteria bacterium]
MRALAASLQRTADGGLRLCYRLEAEAAHLCLPAPVAGAGRADELWRHTCFEAFVAGSGSRGYREFNFSPSGEWAVYAFTAYRAGMNAPDLACAPTLRWQRAADQLSLTATLPSAMLPADTGALRLALAAVIEEQSGTISHWALHHPAGQPDFHHPASFALEI